MKLGSLEFQYREKSSACDFNNNDSGWSSGQSLSLINHESLFNAAQTKTLSKNKQKLYFMCLRESSC